MQKRSSFLTFIAALIPGLGYMYLGLIKKGIQAMVIFFLIEPVFRFLGLGWLASIISIPLWFYLFFDTFNVARKLDRGEFVSDSDFIFNKYYHFNNKENVNDGAMKYMGDKGGIVAGWALVIIGALSIINKLLPENLIYHFIKQSIGTYFVPVLFVFVGVYLLVKKK